MPLYRVAKEAQVMEKTKLSEIMALKNKSLSELKAKYEELFEGKKAPSNNKVYLWRKIAYRIQEIEFGSLSAKAEEKIQEFIQKYDPVNNKALRPDAPIVNELAKKPTRDKRLPIPGTIITKEYKGKLIEVKILDSGFEYNNKKYKSLSSIAKEITGAHWNGFLFFGL
ncbi:MAG: DUF2924 domain-containing protein [Candidatus Omnitrophota bacterium]|nr:MAG: DUF2924 domain-containing protein [Candidatus Omnitrophota bacterium]